MKNKLIVYLIRSLPDKRKIFRYIIKKYPFKIGDSLRRIYYSKYFGNGNFTIKENVTISGYEKDFVVGDNLIVNPNVKIFAGGGILSIGDNVYINFDCFLSASRSKLTIGNDCLIANRVSIWCSNHGYGDRTKLIRTHEKEMKPITIGNDVWIGSHAVILPGSVIGDGCVIGAGAVVNSEIPPYTVATGVPAKVVKNR